MSSSELQSIDLGKRFVKLKQNDNDSIIISADKQSWLAWIDFCEGFLRWQTWLILAYQDIKIRYRRSILGPFWVTLNMAITVYSLGYLYSYIFHIKMQQYYPFLVAGMLAWSLISNIILDCTDGFFVSSALFKHMKLPYTLHIQRIASRNLIIFAHNLLVMIPVFGFFHEGATINGYTLLLIPGLLIIYVNSLSFGLMVAMISARFSDMSQFIKNLVQILFFITPVMWAPELLQGKNHFIVDLNPFYAFLECIREPLLGKLPTLNNIIIALVVTILGCIASSYLFIRFRSLIIYWL